VLPLQPQDYATSARQVIVLSGHMIDRPDRRTPRFPPSAEPVVTSAIRDALRVWRVGSHTLVISGGACGADIIGVEQALDLGTEAWLLVALPEEDFVRRSVRHDGTSWEARYRSLRRRCPAWFHGAVDGHPDARENAFERNNDWCLDVGCSKARGRLQALVVWDGLSTDDSGGTADFVERARRRGAVIAVVDPLSGRRTTIDATP